ncbi:MAG: low specificity L-threonine aldolase [Bdellovibrionota bacterium]
MRGFGSDNHSGSHPLILAALAKTNEGHQPSYGTDPVTIAAQEIFRKHMGVSAETHFVFNGTAANVLSLAAFVKPHHSVLSSAQSHLINDECGAPERFLGAKIIGIPTADGKLRVEDIRPHLIRRGDQHFSQVRAISITQPTELGTVYSLEELKAISELARSEKLVLHVDGSRLVNAAASLGCSLKEAVGGADVVSFGGTKNGLVFGEAVVFMNQDKGFKPDTDFKFIRKQAMQLPSKTRFIAAQFIELLAGDLWLKNARQANDMAKRLSSELEKSPYVRLTQKTQVNGCFAIIPKELVSPLREISFFYVWDEHTFECRLMTSWDTESTDIDGFVSALNRLAKERNVKPIGAGA